MAELYRRLYLVFHPSDETGVYSLLLMIAWLVLAFLLRKEFGGFFRAWWKILVAGIMCYVLYLIHPIFLVATIVAALLQACGVKGNWPFGLVALGLLMWIIYNYFIK